MPRTKKAPTPVRPSTPPTAQLAYDKVRSELEAVDMENPIQVNIDIPQGVSTVLGALPGILSYREALARLDGFNILAVDRLETYALAVWYAHLQALPTTKQSQVKGLVDEAFVLRANLLIDADVLVKRGLFDGQAVAAVRAGHGYVDLANDLVALSAMYQQAWELINGRTFITESDVSRASHLGPEVLAAIGARAHEGPGGDPEAVDPMEQKVRAFALFFRAYDEVRRGLVYLRWHEDDADLIAPSLYRRGSRSTGRTEAAPPRAPEEAAPVPVPVAAPDNGVTVPE